MARELATDNAASTLNQSMPKKYNGQVRLLSDIFKKTFMDKCAMTQRRFPEDFSACARHRALHMLIQAMVRSLKWLSQELSAGMVKHKGRKEGQ